ncbi:MAG: protein phosphatase 2C domain-containing protein [Verrucomicrobiaceae bacterium]
MKVITHTEPGGKAVNEDFILARRHPQDESVMICCIADGQGGRSNGAVASKAACELFFESVSAVSPMKLFEDRAILNLLNQVDGRVSATGGFTTLAVLVLDRDMAAGASAGDSKVYARDSAGQVIEVSSKQRKNPPVGSGDAIFEPFMAHAVGGSRVLMMTDGVWKYAGYESIQRALVAPDLNSVPELLRRDTLARGGSLLPDDFSLIAIQID